MHYFLFFIRCIVYHRAVKWKGFYSSWAVAMKYSSGYDSFAIFKQIKAATLQVKAGQYPYERDGVVFETVQHNWALQALILEILRTIKKGEPVHIIDFGGSLGSTYFQLKYLFEQDDNIQWSIIEQPHFVTFGQQEISGKQLHFFNTIEEAIAKHGKPIVILCSSVIQYLPNAFEFINQLLCYQSTYLLVDRTSFIDDSKHRISVQSVTKAIVKSSYPCYFFNEKLFVALFKNYKKLYTFNGCFETPIYIKTKRCCWKGMLFKMSNDKT